MEVPLVDMRRVLMEGEAALPAVGEVRAGDRPSLPFFVTDGAGDEVEAPCVLAGTSAAGCCSRCLRPRERVLDISYLPLSQRREGRKDRLVFEMEMRQVREARTIGWRPTCACGADTVPAVVFDPFAGTGTALAVAKRLGRQAIGVELNGGYIQHIKCRLLEQTRPGRRRDEAA